MTDAITVLGSRHGILLEPHTFRARAIRFDMFDREPVFGLVAGIRIGKRRVLFPFCEDAREHGFAFVDQRISAVRSSWVGIDPKTRMKVTLSVVTPFRPRDAEFSTCPALAFEMAVELLPGPFRWELEAPMIPDQMEMLFGIEWPGGNGPVTVVSEASADSLALRIDATVRPAEKWNMMRKPEALGRTLEEAIVAPGTRRDGNLLVQSIAPAEAGRRMFRAYWCACSDGVLNLDGEVAPFRYRNRFNELSEVVQWARVHGEELWSNADCVDRIVHGNDLGLAANRLLSYSLHAWLACTWWVRGKSTDWFSVWEGNCYFHSTVDVEFTQAPFYLSVWPELLAMQLDQWTAFAQSGEQILSSQRGAGTAFLAHDCGAFAGVGEQCYPHAMPVEESADYVLLIFAYSRRTGDLDLVVRNQRAWTAFLRFLIRSDESGNGVPEHGVANTIDDGSPAVQFGKEQTYLGIKTLAALEVGATLAEECELADLALVCRGQSKRLRATIESSAWCSDHYAVLLRAGGELIDPWTGETRTWTEIPGWNSTHIYAPNTLPILDMIGFNLGLPTDRVVEDIENGLARCGTAYGCVHSDFVADHEPLEHAESGGMSNLPQASGWISMNMLRDLAGFYRSLDLRPMAERYWDWQATTNTRESRMFFETFRGNFLHFYPRGVAYWGIFDAVGGVSLDQISGLLTERASLGDVVVPLLHSADWEKGSVRRCGACKSDPEPTVK